MSTTRAAVSAWLVPTLTARLGFPGGTAMSFGVAPLALLVGLKSWGA